MLVLWERLAVLLLCLRWNRNVSWMRGDCQFRRLGISHCSRVGWRHWTDEERGFDCHCLVFVRWISDWISPHSASLCFPLIGLVDNLPLLLLSPTSPSQTCWLPFLWAREHRGRFPLLALGCWLAYTVQNWWVPPLLLLHGFLWDGCPSVDFQL